MDEPRKAREPFPDIPAVRAGRLEKTGASTRSLSDLARLWVASGGGRVPVSGRSMRPTFDDASRVWMKTDPQIRFGDVIVFVNEEWYQADPTLGWTQLATGGFEVHKIPGNHATYITDHIDVLASALRQCLERAASETQRP